MKALFRAVGFSGMLILIIFLAFANSKIHAQGIDHEFDLITDDSIAIAPPHGGKLMPIENYFIEILNKDNSVSYYLYDKDIKPVSNKGVKAIASFKFPNKSMLTLKLIAEGLNGFHTGKRNMSNYVSCKTSFWINKKSVKVEFIKPVINSIKFTCSLHPEIVLDKPGKCPKCGMDLIEKKELAKQNNKSIHID